MHGFFQLATHASESYPLPAAPSLSQPVCARAVSETLVTLGTCQSVQEDTSMRVKHDTSDDTSRVTFDRMSHATTNISKALHWLRAMVA